MSTRSSASLAITTPFDDFTQREVPIVNRVVRETSRRSPLMIQSHHHQIQTAGARAHSRRALMLEYDQLVQRHVRGSHLG